jgi:hypothetical protein
MQQSTFGIFLFFSFLFLFLFLMASFQGENDFPREMVLLFSGKSRSGIASPKPEIGHFCGKIIILSEDFFLFLCSLVEWLWNEIPASIHKINGTRCYCLQNEREDLSHFSELQSTHWIFYL